MLQTCRPFQLESFPVFLIIHCSGSTFYYSMLSFPWLRALDLDFFPPFLYVTPVPFRRGRPLSILTLLSVTLPFVLGLAFLVTNLFFPTVPCCLIRTLLVSLSLNFAIRAPSSPPVFFRRLPQVCLPLRPSRPVVEARLFVPFTPRPQR